MARKVPAMRKSPDESEVQPSAINEGRERPAEALEMQDQVQQRAYLASLVASLHVSARDRQYLWPHQVRGIEKLRAFVESGGLQGLLKYPGGAGKTRLGGEILKKMGVLALWLVPSKNLISNTMDEFVGDDVRDIDGAGFTAEEVIPMEVTPQNTATEGLEEVMEYLDLDADFKGTVIMTYQSFLSIFKSNPDLLARFMSKVKVIISDEAHRSIGPKTKESLQEHRGTEPADVVGRRRAEMETVIADEEQALALADFREYEAEIEIKDLVQQRFPVLHLRLTATPELKTKNVADEYDLEIIDSVPIQELVGEGYLILPQLETVGTAVYQTTESIAISGALLDRLAEANRFVMENGAPVEEVVTNRYMELLEENDDYLPGIAFCSTIRQAEHYRQYLEKQGLRAVRCTTATGEFDEGVSPDQAKELLHNEEVDVVVTVGKIAEGWNVPTLRCALWLTPRQSPADRMQANARIMRNLISTSHHPAKSRDNTYIIEPYWQIVRIPKRLGALPRGSSSRSTKRQKKPRTLFAAPNFYETLISQGEMERKALREASPDARLHMAIDLQSDDHLRILIGSIHDLVQNGRGIALQKANFENGMRGWEKSGKQIGIAIFRRQDPGSKEAEKLAKRLWPEEVKFFILNWDDDDHLRALISFDELVQNGRGVNLASDRVPDFHSNTRGWTRSPGEVGSALWGNSQPGMIYAEDLAFDLYRKEAEFYILDWDDDDHLRELLPFDKLVQNGRGVSLQGAPGFESETRGWTRSGLEVGAGVFKNNFPGTEEAEKLALDLWPEKAKFHILDWSNEDHLRELIEPFDELVENGKGLGLKTLSFASEARGWTRTDRSNSFCGRVTSKRRESGTGTGGGICACGISNALQKTGITLQFLRFEFGA